MERRDKSLLDGMKVKESPAFTELAGPGAVKPAGPQYAEIVGACSRCGSPIYGEKSVLSPAENGVRCWHTCECRNR